MQQACIDLFTHYNVHIAPRHTGCAPIDLALCGIIGFTGDLRGSLMLASTLEPLQLAQGGGTESMRDWLAELTNQLIGRVKNRMLGLGVTIHCSTPVVLGGERIAPIESQSLGHLFTADGGVVSVWFDTEPRPDLVLAIDESSAAGREGETLLF